MALTNNLISVWRMNNNWQDSFGSNNGTAYGAIFSTDSKLGSHAGSFDGTDDKIITLSTGFPSGNASFTMCGWFKTTSTQFQTVCGFSGPNVAGKGALIALLMSAQSYAVRYGIHTYVNLDIVPSPAYYNGNYHFVVMTYNSSTSKVKAYYDGVYIGQATPFGTPNFDPQRGGIGYAVWVESWWMKGLVDEGFGG